LAERGPADRRALPQPRVFTALMSPARFSRPRAPTLSGRRWLNADGRLALGDFRGSVVLLHFWTSGSPASLDVLDAVRDVAGRFPGEVAVLGIHSPKFSRETDAAALAAAVERHGIAHPVLDDAEGETWAAYGVTSSPTFVVVDPAGDVLAHMAGACHAAGLSTALEWVVEEHRARGALRPGSPPDAGPARDSGTTASATPLRFPSKALPIPGDRRLAGAAWSGGMLASDTGHAQLVVHAPDLASEVGRIGTGEPGLVDGGPGTARFAAPQGLALLPTPVAAAVGYDVVVADTGTLRGVRLTDGSVRTLAGGPGRAEIQTPTDVAWFDGFVAVAMATAHQVWAFVPAVDPARQRLGVLAGTGYEGHVDGPSSEAWFAQPSGLSASADGQTLWIVDAQSSSVRWLRRSLIGGYEVGTGVGHGLFDFGFSDGPREQALLQHPLGVSALPDGSVAVADTYNGAVRRFDPRTGDVSTLAGSLHDPGDVVATDDGVVVVESGAHRLVRVPTWPDGGRHVRRALPRSRRPVLDLAPGTVHVEVRFAPGAGEADRNGGGPPPTWLALAAEPAGLLETGVGSAPGLQRDVVLPDPAAGGYESGVVHVAAGAGPRYEQDWGLPVRVVRGGAKAIVLNLRHP
jgi:hypothetical protein